MRRANWIATLLAAVVSVVGCKGSESTSNDIGTPTAGVLNPTGTIQGVLTDAVTQQPIVGAVISIGAGSATTAADGQFVIWNVPATSDPLNGTVTGAYMVTIDLQNVTSPVAGGATGGYPKFSYDVAEVVFTSLDDTNGDSPGSGSGSNHDTPVYGLVASISPKVGKLASTISGTVGGCDAAPAVNEFTPESATYTVKLISADSDNSTTGAAGNVVASTTTTSGAFSFANVESLQTFKIVAVDAANTFDDEIMVTALGDGETQNVWMHACSTDDTGPKIVLVSPEAGADIAPSDTQAVTFTFNEAIAQNSLTSTVPGIPGNLYAELEVVYAGNKAGNVAHSLQWDSTFTQLTVTFATSPSGKFYIRFPAMAGLKDQYGNAATPGVCNDDGAIPGAYGAGDLDNHDAVTGEPNDCTAYFTTNGGPDAAAPTGLVVTNLNELDVSGAPVLDWLPAVGAKKYSIYRQCFQWPGYPVAVTGDLTAVAGAEASTQVRLDNSATAAYTDFADGTVELIEGDNIPLACTYTVKSINSDGIESATGVSVNVSDKVRPQISGATFPDSATVGALPTAPYTIAIQFGEHMNEAAAETVANYTPNQRAGFAAPTIAANGIQYTSQEATLSFSSLEVALVPTGGVCPHIDLEGNDQYGVAVGPCVAPGGASGWVRNTTTLAGDDVACDVYGGTGNVYVCAGADGICQTRAFSDTQAMTVGTQAATPSATDVCVGPGGDGVLDTAAAGDDVVSGAYILTGPDFTCNTTAANDVQVTDQYDYAYTPTCVSAAANGIVDTTTLGGDDIACAAGVCAGTNGVCETTAAAGDYQVTSASSVTPKCVVYGSDSVLETAAVAGTAVRSSVASIGLSSSITDVAGNAISTSADRVTTQVVGGTLIIGAD